MVQQIAILEDNVERIAEMRACLAEVLPAFPATFFEDVFEMISWLELHLGEVVLISLDHDLQFIDAAGKRLDCGDGRMMADFLASLPPTCPVVVHSSNNYCAPGMFFALEQAGWPVTRVVPYDDHAWVRSAWLPHLKRLVKDGWIIPPEATEQKGEGVDLK